ncbi:alpha-glucan family phosphorylase [Desulfosudis oleivorans]|uniref:Alpha-glucan phosphorylase n=1 Tax=Desulfosudis oleivorans (strain DSM 6200 / JCM 39069 / Hxd3) TaxID=96561 RepID=A8ZVV0_DESOH|nr:alpha-glucan family phosphorylase [Desulfosudis oleivorans]ABW66659.1 alpha-glucan phosphorylase [Desulfosudis oleivorans Hxd3]
MSFLQTFQVFPKVPEQLKFLEVLVRNLWWCWNLEVIDLFRRINPKLWEESGRNPIIFFTMIDQNQLDRLAEDTSFLTNMAEVKEKFTHDVMAPSADAGPRPRGEKEVIAYFSMEFGIHESLPLFAGGLGILAGDHLKAASDLGLPIAGVGLFYTNGYFHQYLNHDGWQQEEYPATNLYHLPVERIKDASGNELRVSFMGPDGIIQLSIWKIAVGRVSLFLLDTNIKENPPAIREINSRLYRATGKARLAQEVILGIGGMRALKAMGYTPVVCHMNEGHCSFSTVERLAQIRAQHQVDLKTAIEINARTTVFTTHTPVPAGHDEFPPDLVRPYMVPYETDLGVTADELVRWGQVEGTDPYRPFSMFVLGLHLAQDLNGVSELHGQVARRMWAHVWPRLPEEETPISHITNGVHIPSWISIENALLYQRYLGRDWSMSTWNSELSGRIADIYDEELWRAHEMSRTRLIRSCRKWMVQQYGRRNAPKSVMKEAESVLDDGVLTIAFARRFASYKRATLLLRDMDRFEAILKSEECPVQFIFAGKAHPKDDEGKRLIQQLVHFARHPLYRHKILFLENYDINIARHLVQGADVWLNTPRRPMEACGTSGMKAAANGVLNVSILDGWWCEGYTPDVGWAIGNGEEYDDHNYQDAVESQALYNVLENDVIPCFYDRESGGVPERWLAMMKASMHMALEGFCAHKMVNRYDTRFYTPGMERYYELTENGAARARQLNEVHDRLRNNWHTIAIETPERQTAGPFRIGQSLVISVVVHLGTLTPEEADVELYYGPLRDVDAVTGGKTQAMAVKEDLGGGTFRYECALTCRNAGRFGFTVRAMPRADNYIRFTPGLITWA